MGSKIKNIILFIGIGIVLVVLYYMFLKPKPATPNLVTSSNSTTTTEGSIPTTTNTIDGRAKENSDLSKQFLSLLLSVRSINLDSGIFVEPAFISLKDSTIVLVDDGSEGRSNPFAPIGVDNFSTDTIFSPSAGVSSNVTPPASDNTTDVNEKTTKPAKTKPGIN